MLSVDSFEVLVIRVSPESPPHMVSSGKSTDFFNRYDATSDHMRYEEIAERFRAKYEASGFLSSYKTPSVTIESTAGRTSVSLGTEGFYKNTIEELFQSGGAALAIVAASQGMTGKWMKSLLDTPLSSRFTTGREAGLSRILVRRWYRVPPDGNNRSPVM